MHGLDWPHERWSLTDSFESDPLLTTTSSHTVDEAPFSAGSHEPATHAAIRSHYPDRPTSVVAAVRALLSRGWIESAVMLAEATLNDGVPEGLAAELRCTLIAPLITSGHTAEAIAIADRVLAVPDLATTTFDDTAAGRMLALVLQGDFASDHASKVLQEPDRTCHGQARTAIALTGLATSRVVGRQCRWRAVLGEAGRDLRGVREICGLALVSAADDGRDVGRVGRVRRRREDPAPGPRGNRPVWVDHARSTS